MQLRNFLKTRLLQSKWREIDICIFFQKGYGYYMKPFNFDPNPAATAQSCYCNGKDFPGRVQVKEGNFTGGGAKSSFIGNSGGDLGMEMQAWPVRNTHPFGFTGWGRY